MPRAFNNKEKKRIRTNLINEGTALFEQYGLKKTSLDMIIKQCGIAKGSFYLFFTNKEELFFECLERTEEIIQKELTHLFQFQKGEARQMLTELFYFVGIMHEKFPLTQIMNNPDEYRQLIRVLPEKRLIAHQNKDTEEAEIIAAYWKQMGMKKEIDGKIIDGIIKCAIFSRIHKKEIGENDFDAIWNYFVEALAAGLAITIFEEG